MSLAKHGKS